MNDVTRNTINEPAAGADPLTELLRIGARELIAQAVEAELETLLASHQDVVLTDGRRAVVRNGYLPSRTVQTGIGDVMIKVPKVRDRSGSGVKFNVNVQRTPPSFLLNFA